MTIGELIAKYRSEAGLSQRAFAERCGVSNGYISLLESGVNPQTGNPIVPTLPKLKAIAQGMNMTLDHLMRVCDDMPVDLRRASDDAEDDDPEFITLAHRLKRLDPADRKRVEDMIKLMFPEDFE